MRQAVYAFTIFILIFCSSCADDRYQIKSNRYFPKLSDSQLVLGETKKNNVLDLLGEPSFDFMKKQKSNNINIVGYFYSELGGRAIRPEISTPVQVQKLWFSNDILVGKLYTSSFYNGSTLFYIQDTKRIKEGLSVSDVVEILGPPGGGYIYPLLGDNESFAYDYSFWQTLRTATKFNGFIVVFNKSGLVERTKLISESKDPHFEAFNNLGLFMPMLFP